MPRRYQRRTTQVPQDERGLKTRAEVPEYYDTDKLVDVFMLHLLSRGLEAKLGSDRLGCACSPWDHSYDCHHCRTLLVNAPHQRAHRCEEHH